MNELKSCIYQGAVFHQRLRPLQHRFSYRIFFLAIDLDELPQLSKMGPYFKTERFAPLRFFAPDYLANKQQISRQDVWDKVVELGGDDKFGRIVLVGQMRCFGLYFSPINSYYCYDHNDNLSYLVAEVSNTPWNERQYYLIDTNNNTSSEKTFHVSPFMDLDMRYHWQIQVPGEYLNLSIETIQDNDKQRKLFTAAIVMKRQEFNNKNLLKNLLAIPVMTLKTLLGIYWQATKLYIKGVPYVAHSKKENRRVS